MANLNVAVIGSPGYSRELGKKGTESDVTIYNMKKGDDTLTIIEPSRYPEKLAPLSYSVFSRTMQYLWSRRLMLTSGKAFSC